MSKPSTLPKMPTTIKRGNSSEQSSYKFWKLLLYDYFNLSYLFLFSEFCFHLFVTRLILSNAMSSYKIAADVSQLWILFASFLYQSKKIIYIWKLSMVEGKKKSNLLFVRSPWKWKYVSFLLTYLTKRSWCYFVVVCLFSTWLKTEITATLHRVDLWAKHS